MSTRLSLAALLALVLALPAAAGANRAGARTLSAPGGRAPGERGSALARAAAATLAADSRIAIEALGSDRVPAGARAVLAGPALRALASAASARRREGLRLRMLRSRLQIVSLRALAHGGAALVARWRQRLAPLSLAGTPRGRPLELDERASLLLRPSRHSRLLVVWKVELLR